MSLPTLTLKGHRSGTVSQLVKLYFKVPFQTLTCGRGRIGIVLSERYTNFTATSNTTSQNRFCIHNKPAIPLPYYGPKTSMFMSVPNNIACALSTSASLSHENSSPGHSRDSDSQEVDKAKFQYKTWKVLMTVPNFLTFSRVLLTPYLGYLVLSESYVAACGLFLFAGITDILDGWIARKFPSQASPVGSFMDPLADKFLVMTVFLSLSIVHLIPAPLTFLVVLRDVSLIAAAFYVRIISLPSPITVVTLFDLTNQTAELKPTLISKANTGIQLSLVLLTLGAPVVNCVDHPVLQVLWWMTAVTTLWSGVWYIFAKDTFTVYQKKSKRNDS